MAKNISAKKPQSGNTRSKALNATKRKYKPNLQTVTVDGIKVKLSAREARTLKKDSK
jgi:large subunit ribosomal protein L28